MKLARTIALTVAVAAFGSGAALAQTTPSTGSQGGGTTTGPASPSHQPATLGSGGQPATPHQANTLNQGGSSGNEAGGQKPSTR